MNDEVRQEEARRTKTLNFLMGIFALWALFIFIDFSGINTHRIDGKAVNVILGFSVYGIYAKIMDVIQLTVVSLIIYGIYNKEKITGFCLPVAYCIYSFVSMHSFSIMLPQASVKVKILFDLFSLIGGGVICLLLYLNRECFKRA